MRAVHLTALAAAAGIFGVTAHDIAQRIDYGLPAFNGLHVAVLSVVIVLAYLGGKGALE